MKFVYVTFNPYTFPPYTFHPQPIHLSPIHLPLDTMTESLSTDDFDPSILTSDFTSTPDESDRKKRRLNEEL
jgi:hypothetical protein